MRRRTLKADATSITRRVLLGGFAAAILAFLPSLDLPALAQKPAAPRQPKLILAIVVDQFRYDLLFRYEHEYTGGFRRMLDQGAVFTNARYHHVPTVTAVGHSTFLSGATPAISGIIGNEWWDWSSKGTVTSVSDTGTQLLGGSGIGSSPRRLLVSTLGDELKASGKGGKVIGVSIKDRAAILPSGHSANAAYWFDGKTGNFVSSTYYFAALPAWVQDFDKSRPADPYEGHDWLGHKMPHGGSELYEAIDATPFSNELVEKFAARALAAEKLGAGPKIDMLTVSFSGNDYVGHRYGPDSPEAHDAALRVDKMIGELIAAAEAQAGAGNVVAVMTADHGVAPVPEENVKRGMPGGRINLGELRSAAEQALEARFGGSNWITNVSDGGVYLNIPALTAAKDDVAEAERTAAAALRAQPHVFRVYTRTQLMNGQFASDLVGTDVRDGFNAARTGNLIVIFDPYWIASTNGTTHSSPFDYDTHVPVFFWGAGIRPGRYNGGIAPNDIAPTLATMLNIPTPSGSVGHVLTEILK